MCGINGIHGILTESDARKRIETMNQSLAHRGPDAAGIYYSEMIAFGHRRLSIIDPTPGSNQPMTDVSGRYTIVFNGELYNYRELRKTLKHYDFQTDGDTEVLLAGFAKWGINFIKTCNGMFAFAFWDKEKEELTLVRDRLGIKPLYYARTHEHTLFSSEIRALLSSGMIDRQLNRNTIGEYLRYSTVHGSNTIIDGVYMLPPGSAMTITDTDNRIDTYWHASTNYRKEMARMDYTDTTAIIRKSLSEAVERRLVADVPMGAFLSGGIDSGSLVALAAQKVDRLKTFTVTFSNAEFDESRYARMIADKYQTDHTESRLEPRALLDVLPDAIRAMDFPTGDGINTYLVSSQARAAGISVVLSGLGGDEFFAGYDIFRRFYSLRDKGWLMSFPKFIRRLAGNTLEMIKPGMASYKTRQVLTEDYLDLEYVYQYNREISPKELVREMSSNGDKGIDHVYALVKKGVGFGTPGFQLPLLSRVSYAETVTYLQAILLRDSDQMSMAHALELRVPFLDHELVDIVMGVPDTFKYPATPKKLLTDAMGDLLPPEIINRPKVGFTFPWDKWMRNELKEFCGDHIQMLAKNPMFSGPVLEKRWNAFLKGDPMVTWMRVWYLCVLQAWISQNGIR